MKHFLPSFVLAILFTTYHQPIFAQAKNATIQISGEGEKTITLSIAEIKAMPHTTLSIKGHDEKIHTYSGVMLSVLLNKAGIPMGEAAKKKTVSSYILIKASDEYSTVYALAEADSLFTDKKIILADHQDGKPLSGNNGPFQIISTGEKKHGRMIRQVVSISVGKP